MTNDNISITYDSETELWIALDLESELEGQGDNPSQAYSSLEETSLDANGELCDVCKTLVKGVYGRGEMLKIKTSGGYGSLIGDGVHWELKVCEECIVDKFGNHIRKGK